MDPEELALVAPASQREIVFEGGPQPWILDPSHYFQTVSPQKPDLVAWRPSKTVGMPSELNLLSNSTDQNKSSRVLLVKKKGIIEE